MTNKPYSRSKYTTSEYTSSVYTPGKYTEGHYTALSYADSEFDPGADAKDTLLGRINLKDATIGILGLNNTGISMAQLFANAGFHTVGVDGDLSMVERLLDERPKPLSSQSSENLHEALLHGLSLCDDLNAITSTNCQLITVFAPDINAEKFDAEAISLVLNSLLATPRPMTLWVFECSNRSDDFEKRLTDEIVKRIGVHIGKHVFVAFCRTQGEHPPEKPLTRNTALRITGITPECTEVANALFRRVMDKVITHDQ
ncbi:MAG: hypothetical protein JXR76_32030 [Deltaproteobacteria bacterium]|nr:hypothetical protein [Deltaproteobacteria bacterium]